MKKHITSNKSNSTLNEPLTTYGSTNYYALANHTITKDYIKKVLAICRLNVSELMDILPISIDTYKRKTSFNPPVTEKVLEIEEVYAKGLNAFGDGFYGWMNTENVALGGLVPKELLSNSFGIRKLINQIGRIEHGILA